MEALLTQLQNQQAVPVPTTSQKITDPSHFCGGASELDNFLSHLKQNFRLYPQRWPTDAHRVAYALGLMRSWADHKRKELRTSRATNPSDWATELRNSPEDPCNHNFDAFEDAVRRMYGDPDRRADAASRYLSEMKQGHHDPHETVRQYEQRCRALWREAGWTFDATETQHVIYDLVWAGMHPAVKARIKPLRDDETGRFRDLDELFRKAAAADQIKELQAKQTSAPSSTNASSRSQPNRKRPYSLSSNPSSTTSANTAPANKKPRAKWISKHEYDSRVNRGLCTRCEKEGHKSWECPTYEAAEWPNHFGTGSNSGPVKRQRSFDNRGQGTTSQTSDSTPKN